MKMAENGGHLVVSRVSRGYRDAFRAYEIRVDDHPAGKIKRGEAARIELKPGKHRVSVHIDWCASPRVEINILAGAEIRLTCGPEKSGRGALHDAVRDTDQYIWLRPTEDQ